MRYGKSTWLNSLSLKILLAYVLGVVLSIVLIVIAAYWLLFANSRHFASGNVAGFTDVLAKGLEFNEQGQPTGFNKKLARTTWIFESLKDELGYRVADESGRVVLKSVIDDAVWEDINIRNPSSGVFALSYHDALIYGATVAIQHNNQTWHLQFIVSARLHYLLHQIIALPFITKGIIFFSLILFFLFGICGYLTLKYTLKPLHELSKTAADISPRSLNARLYTKDVPSEMLPLVNSFNRVLDRLEHGYKVQQEFLATAAHELKTPLALIRAQIEMTETGDDRHILLSDVAHMSRQVQQLLLLAEVSEAQNYHLDNVTIADVVNEVARFLQPMAKISHVNIHIAHIMDAEWQADRSALFVLIKNLLENAIQHAPANSQIIIEITEKQLSVRDFGSGVDQEQISKIFLRFWRGAHRRDHGAGLGLAICQEIAHAHGWELIAKRAEPGLCFQILNSIDIG